MLLKHARPALKASDFIQSPVTVDQPMIVLSQSIWNGCVQEQEAKGQCPLNKQERYATELEDA